MCLLAARLCVRRPRGKMAGAALAGCWAVAWSEPAVLTRRVHHSVLRFMRLQQVQEGGRVKRAQLPRVVPEVAEQKLDPERPVLPLEHGHQPAIDWLDKHPAFELLRIEDESHATVYIRSRLPALARHLCARKASAALTLVVADAAVEQVVRVEQEAVVRAAERGGQVAKMTHLQVKVRPKHIAVQYSGEEVLRAAVHPALARLQAILG